jgi:hypothetical protein
MTFFQSILEKLTCMHAWETHATVETATIFSDKTYKVEQTLICKKCGKIRKIKL